MEKKIFVCCPPNSYTGGPTLAHQLCYVLNKRGLNAYMWYVGNKAKMRRKCPVHNLYKKFNNPYVIDSPSDFECNHIIAIETKVSILQSYFNAKKYIWWMSVDNYYLIMGSLLCLIRKKYFGFNPSIEYCKRYKDKKKYRIIFNQDITHLVQSEYARLFLLENNIENAKIYELSDYLEDEVLSIKQTKENRSINTVLYNPKKGVEFTKMIIQELPDLNWVAIENMNKTEVIELLTNSRLYIDFGNHPGKDRFPREAVMCGCCVITGKEGAARNDIDIPISSDYKFENSFDNIKEICMKIKEVLINYDHKYDDFIEYRNIILLEKNKFQKQIENIFIKGIE